MAISPSDLYQSLASRPAAIKRGAQLAFLLFLSANSGVAGADAACDAEVQAIKTELAAHDGSTDVDVERARQMLQVLIEDCSSGSTLESVESLSATIREALGMEVRTW